MAPAMGDALAILIERGSALEALPNTILAVLVG